MKPLVLMVIAAAKLGSQPNANPQAFEVASIKLMKDRPDEYIQPIRTSPETLRLHFVSLGDCLAWAYHVHDFQITGVKLPSERYEVTAKAPGRASSDELRMMLQTLLAERFRVVHHRDSKIMSVYALLPGKKLRMDPADGDGELSFHRRGVVWTFDHASMFDLAELLMPLAPSPVVDMTGLKGKFKFTVDASSYIESATDGDGQPRGSSPFFSAAQDQLGLKIESRKVAIDVLVVDTFAAPSEN